MRKYEINVHSKIRRHNDFDHQNYILKFLEHFPPGKMDEVL